MKATRTSTCKAITATNERCTHRAIDGELCGTHRRSLERGGHEKISDSLYAPTHPEIVGEYVGGIGDFNVALLDAYGVNTEGM